MLALLMLAHVVSAAEARPLQPLDFLVGHCWSGELPNGGGRDTHCFEPMYGGRFVHDKHVVHNKGPDYLGETIYGWDPKLQRIFFWYWSNDGVVEQGSAAGDAEGLRFAEHTLTSPKDMTLRVQWRRKGDDAYEAINEVKEGDAWKLAWKVEYRRDKR